MSSLPCSFGMGSGVVLPQRADLRFRHNDRSGIFLLLTPLLWSRYLRRYEILYLIAPCLASGIAAIFAWSSDKRDRRDSILFALFSATYVYPLLRRVIRNLRNRRA